MSAPKMTHFSVSTDGQTFREVGKHVFPLAKATRASISFPNTEAQYIRLTYLDHRSSPAISPTRLPSPARSRRIG